MIHFSPDRYFSTMWFLGFEGFDMLGALWRFNHEPEKWELIYRFRYDADPAEGTEERRQWYSGVAEGPEAQVESKTGTFFRALQVIPGKHCHSFYEIPIKDNGTKAAEILSSFQFCKISPSTPKDKINIEKAKAEEKKRRAGKGTS